jgi:hypothetical protein
VLAAAVLLGGWRIARRRASARDSRSWAGPAAVAAGFTAGYWALFGRPDFPPLDAVDWLLYLAPAVAVLGLADSWLRLRLPARLLLAGVTVPAVFLVLAWPLVRAGGAGGTETLGRVAIASIAAFDAWSVRVAAAWSSAVLVAVAGPAAIVVALSGSLRLGQIGLLLAGCAAGSLAGSLVLGSAAVGRGMALVFGALLGGLLLCGTLYAELATSNAMLLAAAPGMVWLGQLVPRRAGWLGTTLARLALVLTLPAIALVRAWLRFAEEAW